MAKPTEEFFSARSLVATFFLLLGVIYVGSLEFRLAETRRAADRAWACGAGHSLSGCRRFLGEPTDQYASKARKAQVTLWSSGRSGTSYTIAAVSRDGVILNVFNLDSDEGSLLGAYPRDEPARSR